MLVQKLNSTLSMTIETPETHRKSLWKSWYKYKQWVLYNKAVYHPKEDHQHAITKSSSTKENIYRLTSSYPCLETNLLIVNSAMKQGNKHCMNAISASVEDYIIQKRVENFWKHKNCLNDQETAMSVNDSYCWRNWKPKYGWWMEST